MEQVETGFICCMECSFPAHPAKPSGCYTTVFLTVPRTSPSLNLNDLSGCITYKNFYCILICKKITSFDSVIGMKIVIVILFQYSSRAALCCYCMAPHWIYL